MRLRQIKISGFKSFAELTTIEIDSSIVGIVGPNGCGKSNVIEAVRWALGESRASEMRSKTMSELIFSGSESRKPAGRAMVELVFDNTESPVAGPWSAYAEISVKRVLTRDNTSAYLINNQTVRATDVRELFMGTGLGTNSYAIIGQGMIAEFAKDSPERRREYLEEAAGVSKYKKRRKEAETKLTTTRANLDRVHDLQFSRRDLLARLEDQARVAQQYRELDMRRTAQEALWWFVQATESQNTIDRMNVSIAELQAKLQENESQVRALKNALVLEREKLNSANHSLLAKTEELSVIDKKIATLEGNIRSMIERRGLLTEQLHHYQELLARRKQEIQSADAKIDSIALALEELAALIEESYLEVEAKNEAEIHTQAVVHDKRTHYEQKQKKAAEIALASRRESLEIEQLTRTRNQLEERLQKLKHQVRQIERPNPDALKQLQEQTLVLNEEKAILIEGQCELQASLQLTKNAQDSAQLNIRQKEQHLARLQARLVTLKELEERARSGDALAHWLKQQGLDSLERLFQSLEVQPRWAHALESVLRERVNALGISRLNLAAGFEHAAPPAKLAFYSKVARVGAPEAPLGFKRLLDCLSFNDKNAETVGALSVWLAPYLLADSVAEACSHSEALAAGFAFITPAGHVIDAASVQFWADDDHSGVLSRRAEMAQLSVDEKIEIKRVQEAHLALTEANLKVSEVSRKLQSVNTQIQATLRQEQTLAVEIERLKAALHAFNRREGELAEQIEETTVMLEETLEALQLAQERFAEHDEILASAQESAYAAQTDYETALQDLRQLQDTVRLLTLKHRELKLKQASLTEQQFQLERRLLAEQNEERAWVAKIADVKAQLNGLDDTGDRLGLETLLGERLAAQEALNEARGALDSKTEEAKGLEAQIAALDEQKRLAQLKMGELMMRRQNHEIEHATVASRLADFHCDDSELRLRYETERPKQNALRLEVERLAKEMAALGAVNHAALEQLEIETAENERIARELEDLQAAIETIEAAIKRIDQETRALMMNTFNKVNAAFSEKFTQLFKGGSAHLVMVGDDALEAGIEMVANPPGKHPHSIRQLSGGELTLTATALVFAFFTLNPAPFCLLDEIDAPLDEANQQRLAHLIRTMSRNTQFMIITHHRLTMEHTEELVGVTMKEPGVSRVVSVDITQAQAYAQKTQN